MHTLSNAPAEPTHAVYRYEPYGDVIKKVPYTNKPGAKEVAEADTRGPSSEPDAHPDVPTVIGESETPLSPEASLCASFTASSDLPLKQCPEEVTPQDAWQNAAAAYEPVPPQINSMAVPGGRIDPVWQQDPAAMLDFKPRRPKTGHRRRAAARTAVAPPEANLCALKKSQEVYGAAVEGRCGEKTDTVAGICLYQSDPNFPQVSCCTGDFAPQGCYRLTDKFCQQKKIKGAVARALMVSATDTSLPVFAVGVVERPCTGGVRLKVRRAAVGFDRYHCPVLHTVVNVPAENVVLSTLQEDAAAVRITLQVLQEKELGQCCPW